MGEGESGKWGGGRWRGGGGKVGGGEVGVGRWERVRRWREGGEKERGEGGGKGGRKEGHYMRRVYCDHKLCGTQQLIPYIPESIVCCTPQELPPTHSHTVACNRKPAIHTMECKHSSSSSSRKCTHIQSRVHIIS